MVEVSVRVRVRVRVKVRVRVRPVQPSEHVHTPVVLSQDPRGALRYSSGSEARLIQPGSMARSRLRVGVSVQGTFRRGGGLFPHIHACKAVLAGMQVCEGGFRVRVRVRVR